MTESKFRKCHEPHLRDYPECFEECECLDVCEAPLFSESVPESKVKLELKPALKKYGANVAVDVLEEKKNQLAADQQVVDRLAAENEELYEALKAIHPHSTGYMESMSWRVYNGALYKVNIAIANYKERHKEAH